MKRILCGVSLVALATSTAFAAPTPEPTTKPIVPHVVYLKYRVAPADEYFGRLKLSILGIRNTIKDTGLKADADPPHAESVLGALALTEDALHDWEKKYPQDTWIPTALFALERTYAKVDSDFARSKAIATMTWLVHDFPSSPAAKTGKTELEAHRVGVKPDVPPDAAGGANQPPSQ